jgi:hypothetical protein
MSHRDLLVGEAFDVRTIHTMKSALLAYFLSVVLVLDSVHALSSIPAQTTPYQHLQQQCKGSFGSTRGAFLAAGVALWAPSAALAASVPDGIKGTKEDPTFQACLSKCVYECTKPKGELQQRARAECLPECKQKCATTKAQLMKGTAIKKS